MPQRWIGRRGGKDFLLCALLSKSWGLTVRDFFLVEVCQRKVYVPLFSANIDDMKDRKTAAINSVDHDVLSRIWEELSYRLNVVRAAGGGHIQHL